MSQDQFNTPADLQSVETPLDQNFLKTKTVDFEHQSDESQVIEIESDQQEDDDEEDEEDEESKSNSFGMESDESVSSQSSDSLSHDVDKVELQSYLQLFRYDISNKSCLRSSPRKKSKSRVFDPQNQCKPDPKLSMNNLAFTQPNDKIPMLTKNISSFSYKQNVETLNQKETAYQYYINEMELTKNWSKFDEDGFDQQIRQINVIFSQEIGGDTAENTQNIGIDKKTREKEFLDQQYVVLQEYIEFEDTQKRPFCIKQLNNLDKTIFDSAKNGQDLKGVTEGLYGCRHEHSCKQEKQIKNFFHRKLEIGGRFFMIFILMTVDGWLHIKYDFPIENYHNPNIVFFKIGCNYHSRCNHIPNIQSIKIDQSNKLNQFQEDICNNLLYYIIDAKNHIHLVHPNFHDKSKELQLIDLIQKQLSHGFTNYKKMKMVQMKTLRDGKNFHEHKSFIQGVDHLQNALQMPFISDEQDFIFCWESQKQSIFITQPGNNEIVIIQQNSNMKSAHDQLNQKINHIWQSKCAVNLKDPQNKLDLNELFKDERIVDKFYIDIDSMNIIQQFDRTIVKEDDQSDNEDSLTHSHNTCQDDESSSDNLEIITSQDEETSSLEENEEYDLIGDRSAIKVMPLLSPAGFQRQFTKVAKQNNFEVEDIEPLHSISNSSVFIKKRKTIYIQHENGTQVEVRVCKSEYEDFDDIQLECIQRNQTSYIFIFSFVSYSHGQKHKAYLFLKKNVEEITNLLKKCIHIKNKSADCSHFTKEEIEQMILMNENDTVKRLTDGPKLIETSFKQFYLDFLRIDDSDSKYESKCNSLQEFTKTKLTFEKLLDQKDQIDFVLMIYQVAHNTQENKLLIYDINKDEIVLKFSINPSSINYPYLYQTYEGFNVFKLCRTSRFQNIHTDHHFLQVRSNQITSGTLRISIFTFFANDVGRLLVQELIIDQLQEGGLFDRSVLSRNGSASAKNYRIQLYGLKEIFFSNKFIETCSESYVIQSQPVPFQDVLRNIVGCEFLIRLSKNKTEKLYLIDDQLDSQNELVELYDYYSDIVSVGSRKIKIDVKDKDIFVFVISAKFANKILTSRILNIDESHLVLRDMLQTYLQMRRLDLKFILRNSYQDLVEHNFFTPLEILHGRSMFDISLTDHNRIKQALKKEHAIEPFNIKGTILDQILQNNTKRSQLFQEMKIIFQQMIIKLDFNYNSLIERGIKLSALKSVKLAIEFIQRRDKSNQYYNILMFELKNLLNNQQLDINFFFNESWDQKNSINRKQTANIEKLVDFEVFQQLERFSFFRRQFLQLSNLQEQSVLKNQLADALYARQENQKAKFEKKSIKRCCNLQFKFNKFFKVNHDVYPVEHSYIDFRMVLLKHKLDYIRDKNRGNDKFYSYSANPENSEESFGVTNLMVAEMFASQDLTFYNQESVCKIIDFQFEQTRSFMQTIFWFFIIGFIIPYTCMLVELQRTDRQNRQYVKMLMKFQSFSQILLAIVELIRMRTMGWKYIQFWQIVDLTQCVLYWIQYIDVIAQDNTNYKKHLAETNFDLEEFIRVLLIWASLLKLIHYVFIYERFGHLIRMIIDMLHGLIPFFVSYSFFIIFFAVLFLTAEVEIDEEINTEDGKQLETLGYFGLVILAVMRNSVGKLGFFRYDEVVKKNKSCMMNHIYMIWILYFLSIMFLFTMGLNFMVGVIDNTYKKLEKLKDANLHKIKANLNLECMHLLEWFRLVENIQVVLFSLEIERQKDDIYIGHGDEEEETSRFTKMIIKQSMQTNLVKMAKDRLKHLQLVEKRQIGFLDTYKNATLKEIDNITKLTSDTNIQSQIKYYPESTTDSKSLKKSKTSMKVGSPGQYMRQSSKRSRINTYDYHKSLTSGGSAKKSGRETHNQFRVLNK